MAILRSFDGTFYEVPDDQLATFELAPEKVKEALAQAGEDLPAGPPPGAPAGGGGGGQVVIQVFAGDGRPPVVRTGSGGGEEVEAYGACGWRNSWRNSWRNCG